MNAAHTPGPWTVQPRKNNYIDICHNQRDMPGAITLALCRVQSRDSWIDESFANASLIAAAPELLDAVERLLVMLEEPHANEHAQKTEMKRSMSQAKAAIAKATGQSA